MADAITTPHASSSYTYDLPPKTWELIRGMRSGAAVFTMPTGPVKCGGAPQKIAYAADYWREPARAGCSETGTSGSGRRYPVDGLPFGVGGGLRRLDQSG
jgi:hypothetical protein